MSKVFSELIKIRKEKMTQTAVAKAMGVTRQRVSNMENGQDGSPSVETVEKYAKIVGARISVTRRRGRR